jgi:hypothetical protein
MLSNGAKVFELLEQDVGVSFSLSFVIEWFI